MLQSFPEPIDGKVVSPCGLLECSVGVLECSWMLWMVVCCGVWPDWSGK